MPLDFRFWRTFVYAAVAILVFCGIATMREPGRGFTKILHFGAALADQRLPALKNLPLAVTSDTGYDGQYYAQLAVDPRVRSPEVQAAMDDARYRGQRILLPAIAHVLGCGNPWSTLQIYALANVAFWCVFAWLLHRLTASQGPAGLLIWCALVLSLAVLESMHLALTDLPAAVFLVGAVACVQRDGFWRAGLLLGLAGLIRETSLLAVVVLAPASWRDGRAWLTRLGPLLVAVLPVCLWGLYLRSVTPATMPFGGVGNFDWPGVALMRHLGLCARTVFQGQAHLRHVFAPIAAVGFAYQSFSILKRCIGSIASPHAWTLLGAPFAVLFWLLGENVWDGYWAVARACLPMVIAYGLTLPIDRYFIWRLLLPNLCLLHGIQRLLSSSTQ